MEHQDLVNKIHNESNLVTMSKMESESVDIVLTDPPYKYLKNALDTDWDEDTTFQEFKRVLKPDGYVIIFGRGESFYRWNTKLNALGFKFKEEIIWDKRLITSPVLPIGRRHETITIFAKGKGKINKVKVEYLEKYKHEPEKIVRTIKRLKTAFGNRKTFKMLENYYADGTVEYFKSVESKHNVTRAKGSTINRNRTVQFAVGLEEGVMEQSIIAETREHYKTIHGTQKPVKLLERLLNLVKKGDDIVYDGFAGSGSTFRACHNLGLDFIGSEINQEFWEAAEIYNQEYFNSSNYKLWK